jgi:hypothetical protein
MLKKNMLYMLLAFQILSTLAYGATAGNEKELKDVFDAYNGFAKTGDVDKMLALRTAAVEKEIRSQIKKKRDREDFVMMGRAQVPSSYEVQHVTWGKDGKSADLYALWHLPPMKEIDRLKQADVEVLLVFKMEKGKWKMDNILPLADPSQIKRPKDLVYNEKDADEGVTSASVAGRIVKLEFQPDHTLVIVRVMDEEIAVFLPRKETLAKAGVNFDDFAPWKMREFTGYPHKTDKLKFFATGDNAME